MNPQSVTDSQTHSSSDTVTVSFGNVRPVANAGKSQSVKVGDAVTLAGDGTDANGDALSYRWILSSLPGGSLSEMADSSARVTTFTPDRAGTYVAQLVVSFNFISTNRPPLWGYIRSSPAGLGFSFHTQINYNYL